MNIGCCYSLFDFFSFNDIFIYFHPLILASTLMILIYIGILKINLEFFMVLELEIIAHLFINLFVKKHFFSKLKKLRITFF